MSERVVFLFDIDNTLLDNDRIASDLKRFLQKEVGEKRERRYWEIFEELRRELGYADYLGALQRYRAENPEDVHLLCISHYLVDYPFANRLYPESLDVVEYCRQFGPAVVLSDGDSVFQPRKVQRSGLWDIFEGRVLIYIHKELHLKNVEERYPAEHYVMVDDKLRILTAMKKVWSKRLTTIFPKQGHYAHDPEILKTYPAADISIDRIGSLLNFTLSQIIDASKSN